MGVQHGDRHLNRLLGFAVGEEKRIQIVVPGRHEQHDGVCDDRGLAKRQKDAAVCPEIAAAVDLRCVQIAGRQTDHELPHEKNVAHVAKRGRNDHRQQCVDPLKLCVDNEVWHKQDHSGHHHGRGKTQLCERKSGHG